MGHAVQNYMNDLYVLFFFPAGSDIEVRVVCQDLAITLFSLNLSVVQKSFKTLLNCLCEIKLPGNKIQV